MNSKQRRKAEKRAAKRGAQTTTEVRLIKSYSTHTDSDLAHDIDPRMAVLLTILDDDERDINFYDPAMRRDMSYYNR